MRYLLIGISFHLIMSSCEEQDSNIGPLDVTIVYKNETKKTVEYFQYTESKNVLMFDIDPFGQEIIEISSEYDTREGLNTSTCCEGTFESFQGRNNRILIEFDNTKCLVFQSGEGPTTQNISGYEVVLLSDNEIQYTYTFTEEDYLKAEECQ